nr:hypothetical protein CFP56_62072 [Quercus suber]
MRVVGISKVPSRWDVEKELDKFLSGENTVSVAEMTSEGIVGDGPMAGGGQTGKNLINFGNQRKNGKFQNYGGETSRESGVAAKSPMVVPVALMRAKLHSCPVAKLLAPILVASHPNWEVERQIGDDSRNMDSNSPGEGDPWSEEVEEVFMEVPRVSDIEGCDSQTGMTGSEVAYADGMQNCESELLFLPWAQSGVDTTYSGNGENNCGPLECALLSCWVPKVVKDMVLSTAAEEGELDASKVEHSKWVSTMMNSFCKMVGFPIVKHEAQCVALFRLLEQECLEVANESCNR